MLHCTVALAPPGLTAEQVDGLNVFKAL